MINFQLPNSLKFILRISVIYSALISFFISCLPGKFHMHTISKKKAVAEYEEKKFKLAFFDPAADKIFCPNVNVIFTSNTPEGASEFCFSDSNDPNQTCEWKSLPLDIKFKASSENQTLKKYLLFRNSEKVVLNETWESNELTVKPTTIAKTEADQIRQLKTDELTENQMDEYLCRMDEWSYNVAKNIAMNVSDSFTKERKIRMSNILASMSHNYFGLPYRFTRDDISRLGWYLITHTQEPRLYISQYEIPYDNVANAKFTSVLPESLRGMDVSYISLAKRSLYNINFAGTNLVGSQLNELDTTSHNSGFSGLNLAGWKPKHIINVQGCDFSNATNIPWDTINQLTTLKNLNLSGLDLSSWKPLSSITNMQYFSMQNSINVPFEKINAMSGLSYLDADFSRQDLANWQPLPNSSLKFLNLSYSKNIPWSYLNANTSGDGYWGMDFTSLDLSSWDPKSYDNITRIIYKNATNIPWAKINANSSTNMSIFENVDLNGFDPSVSFNIGKISLKNSINIPWSKINSNTNTQFLNLNELDLSAWNPSSSYCGVSLIGSKNIPWAKINNCTNFSWSDFSNQDLSSWSPTSSSTVRGINFLGAKNIPWTKLNALTDTEALVMSNFEGQDLKEWRPLPTVSSVRYSSFRNATNIPWDEINLMNNTTAYAYTDFSGLDLKYWRPLPGVGIYGMNLNKAKNIPWEYLNPNSTSWGFNGIQFQNVDLSQLSPTSTTGVTGYFSKARNIPWGKIIAAKNSTNHFLFGYQVYPYTARWASHVLENTALNMEGYTLNYGNKFIQSSVAIGANSHFDFEEATGGNGYRGVRWWDLTYPWGF